MDKAIDLVNDGSKEAADLVKTLRMFKDVKEHLLLVSLLSLDEKPNNWSYEERKMFQLLQTTKLEPEFYSGKKKPGEKKQELQKLFEQCFSECTRPSPPCLYDVIPSFDGQHRDEHMVYVRSQELEEPWLLGYPAAHRRGASGVDADAEGGAYASERGAFGSQGGCP